MKKYPKHFSIAIHLPTNDTRFWANLTNKSFLVENLKINLRKKFLD